MQIKAEDQTGKVTSIELDPKEGEKFYDDEGLEGHINFLKGKLKELNDEEKYDADRDTLEFNIRISEANKSDYDINKALQFLTEAVFKSKEYANKAADYSRKCNHMIFEVELFLSDFVRFRNESIPLTVEVPESPKRRNS